MVTCNFTRTQAKILIAISYTISFSMYVLYLFIKQFNIDPMKVVKRCDTLVYYNCELGEKRVSRWGIFCSFSLETFFNPCLFVFGFCVYMCVRWGQPIFVVDEFFFVKDRTNKAKDWKHEHVKICFTNMDQIPLIWNQSHVQKAKR